MDRPQDHTGLQVYSLIAYNSAYRNFNTHGCTRIVLNCKRDRIRGISLFRDARGKERVVWSELLFRQAKPNPAINQYHRCAQAWSSQLMCFARGYIDCMHGGVGYTAGVAKLTANSSQLAC